jgi:glycosyltransferase involved in cell wall biosynthesis
MSDLQNSVHDRGSVVPALLTRQETLLSLAQALVDRASGTVFEAETALRWFTQNEAVTIAAVDVGGQKSQARRRWTSVHDVGDLSADIPRPTGDAVLRRRPRPKPWPWPRIGHLRHHKPRPLRVPAKYAKVRPPDPAPTISIVTPSLQQGRFLARTLYSILSQKYPAIECVVQDGGSSDDTPDVLEAFAPLLTYWASEPDGGQADAINRGFAQTSGEIMCWLNSDDLLLPGSLAYVARDFQAHPDVDVVYGHRLMIDEDDRKIGTWILPRHQQSALRLADYIPQETLFWRRRIWDATGGFVDPSLEYALDWDLLLRFQKAGAKFVRLPRYLAAFRVHDAQKSANADNVGRAECALLRERLHGRRMSPDEVLRRLRPYLVCHILAHTRRSAVDHVLFRKIPVESSPNAPWTDVLRDLMHSRS